MSRIPACGPVFTGYGREFFPAAEKIMRKHAGTEGFSLTVVGKKIKLYMDYKRHVGKLYARTGKPNRRDPPPDRTPLRLL